MIILLETYVGCSDFVFQPTCTGRKIEQSELRELGLISDKILKRNEKSSYFPDWYEVKEGDRIRIQKSDDEGDLDVIFVVPSDLPNLPQKLDDFPWTGMRVYDYLVEHCKQL